MINITINQPTPAEKALYFPLSISGYPADTHHVAFFNQMPDGSWKQNGDIPPLNGGSFTLTRFNWGVNQTVQTYIQFFDSTGHLLDESQHFGVVCPVYPDCGLAYVYSVSFENGKLILKWNDAIAFSNHATNWVVKISDVTGGTPEQSYSTTVMEFAYPVTAGHTYKYIISTFCGSLQGTDPFYNTVTYNAPVTLVSPTAPKGKKK